MTIHAQGIRQTPSVKLVVLDSRRRFPFPVAPGAFRIYRINVVASRNQLLHRHPLIRFHSYCQWHKPAQIFSQLLPASSRVFNARLPNHRAVPIHHDYVMVI